VKERPILFSAPMVRALLEGRKTQTRRIVKPQPQEGVGEIYVGVYAPAIEDADGELQPGPDVFGAYDEDGEWGCRCPYGEPGDRLWVRETWAPSIRDPDSDMDHRTGDNCDAVHRATDDKAEWDHYASRPDGSGFDITKVKPKWRPGIHMPKWACRLTLRVTLVRVERLQSITEEDARDEGARSNEVLDWTHRDEFARLWDQLNGERAAWASDPWVWVVGFERVEATP
jgi:hypothetical protein